jgi:plastocyanin
VRRSWLTVIVFLAIAGHAGPRATTPARPARHVVTIEGTSFQPESLRVKSGDVVVWVNKDPFPHTATSKAGGFDSREIGPDKTWSLETSKKGAFAYVCTLHPTMKGVLRVE